jgi:hypothetical protein
VLEEGAYEKLSKWIVTGFPTFETPNMTDTTTMRLLQRFSSSLLFAEYPSTADASPKLRMLCLRAFCRKVELSINVLKALEKNTDGPQTRGNISPVSLKTNTAITSHRRIDPLPFDTMGLAVPTTDAEVRDVHLGVLSQLQSILQVRGFTAASFM